MRKVIAFFAVPVAVYLLFVFVTLQWSPFAWEASARALFVVLSVFGSAVLAINVFGENQ